MKITLDLKQDFSKAFGSSEKKELNNGFKSLLEEDYDSILEKVLNGMSDLEKEAHLKTLEELEKQGYSKEQLNVVNLYVLNQNAKQKFELKLDEDQKALVKQYESMFEQIFNAFKQNHEQRLSYKPLQMQTMMTDTVLKSLDKTGLSPDKHAINIEV